jgi:hypothetical protein
MSDGCASFSDICRLLAFLSIHFYNEGRLEGLPAACVKVMPTKSLAKQERVVESIRRGLSGGAAVAFIHESGYAITDAGIARYLQSMGGVGRVKALIDEGKSNIEILEICFPAAPTAELKSAPPPRRKAGPPGSVTPLVRPNDVPLYETAKMTLHLPADLYEAIRLAARGEGKTQNQLIVDLLTSALSRLPYGIPNPAEESDASPEPQAEQS